MKSSSLFNILLFSQTQFSEQKGSDNHVHQIEFQVYQMIWPNNVGSPKKTQRKKMNKSWASNEVLKIGKFSLNFITTTSQIFAQFRVQNWKILKTRNDEELVGEFVTEISYKSLLTTCRHPVSLWKVILK